jgi:hypothetical protein
MVTVTNGPVVARNLRRSATTPPVTVGELADLWQNPSTGRLYIRKSNGTAIDWVEIATVESGVPVGTIIQSLKIPSEMLVLGWYALDGHTISENSETSGLFGLSTLAGNITGTAPNRSMRLPDMRRRVAITDFAFPNTYGGNYPGNILQIAAINLPRHAHSVNVVPNSAGTPKATMDPSGAHSNHTISGGFHDHVVEDPGHMHQGADWNGIARPFINWVPQGDVNSPYWIHQGAQGSEPLNVYAYWWATRGYTGINIQPNQSHGHAIGGGAHAHPMSFDALPQHDHTVSQTSVYGNAQGQAEPIDISPQYYTVFSYVRS